MQDHEVVAAVAAGDPDGIAAAYDQYAAPLYTYCHLMLPDPADAADAVRDTFLVAAVKLEGLRDPDSLRAWLYAVARNECLSRLGGTGAAAPPPKIPDVAEDAALLLPAGFRGQVIKACTDSTPAGRAERASAAHRAGAFGPAGFPKTMGSPGPQWWRQVRRHPRAAAALTAAAAIVVAAVIVAALTVGGSHRAQAATIALGGGAPGNSASATPGDRAQASPSAGHRSSAATPRPTPSAKAAAPSPGTLTEPGAPKPSAPGPASPSGTHSSGAPSAAPSTTAPSTTAPSTTAPSTAAPSTTAPSTTAPGEGALVTQPGKLLLTAISGKTVSGTFLLSAAGGPVANYTINVPKAVAGKMTVSPARGSLPANRWITITVTATSKVAINTQLTIDPGDITVTVVLTIKA